VVKVHKSQVKQKPKPGKRVTTVVAVFRSSGAFAAATNKQIFEALFLGCRALEVSVLSNFLRIKPTPNYLFRFSFPD
jgi:hypothetical protein